MTDDPITVTDVDDGLSETLAERIYEFNVEATGFNDGRMLRAAQRGPDGSLEAGLSGWTWGGCGYVEYLWVRADLRGAGLGSRLLVAAEAEARARGCAQMVVFSHTFQAPEFYRRHGYVEYARTEGSPTGHADVHFMKSLVRGTMAAGPARMPMSKEGYPTPEEAALAGFTFARVVQVRTHDWNCTQEPQPDQVEVELATNEPPMEYPYFVHVHREGDLWYEGSSHN